MSPVPMHEFASTDMADGSPALVFSHGVFVPSNGSSVEHSALGDIQPAKDVPVSLAVRTECDLEHSPHLPTQVLEGSLGKNRPANRWRRHPTPLPTPLPSVASDSDSDDQPSTAISRCNICGGIGCVFCNPDKHARPRRSRLR